jgi:hypothetical protein
VTTDATGMCDVCGKPGSVHVCEIRDGVKTSRSFCVEHVPSEMRDKIPVPTAADEVKMVEQMIAQLDLREDMDAAQKAEFRRELQQLAEDIKAGRKRFGDAD